MSETGLDVCVCSPEGNIYRYRTVMRVGFGPSGPDSSTWHPSRLYFPAQPEPNRPLLSASVVAIRIFPKRILLMELFIICSVRVQRARQEMSLQYGTVQAIRTSIWRRLSEMQALHVRTPLSLLQGGLLQGSHQTDNAQESLQT